MDCGKHPVNLRVVRSDGQEWSLGAGTGWYILEDGLEDLNDVSYSVETAANVLTDGSSLVGKRVEEKDRTVECQYSGAGKSEERGRVLAFLNPKFSFQVYVTYMGRTRWYEGELLKSDVGTGNVNKPMVVTFTILCLDPYLKDTDRNDRSMTDAEPMFGFPFVSIINDRAMADQANKKQTSIQNVSNSAVVIADTTKLQPVEETNKRPGSAITTENAVFDKKDKSFKVRMLAEGEFTGGWPDPETKVWYELWCGDKIAFADYKGVTGDVIAANNSSIDITVPADKANAGRYCFKWNAYFNGETNTVYGIVDDSIYVDVSKSSASSVVVSVLGNLTNNDKDQTQEAKELISASLGGVPLAMGEDFFVSFSEPVIGSAEEDKTFEATITYSDNFEGTSTATITVKKYKYVPTLVTRGFLASRLIFDGKNTIYNFGDVPCFYQIVLKAGGKIVNPTITKDEGNFVKVMDTMQDGDEIIIDFESSPPKLTKNGENYIQKASRDSSFTSMEMQTGANVFQISMDNEENRLLLDVKILFYEKYMGV